MFALTLVKPGKLGPTLHRHADGPPCSDYASWSGKPAADGTFPPVCDSPAVLRKANRKVMLLG